MSHDLATISYVYSYAWGKGRNIPDDRTKSSMITLLPEVGYLADTPLATKGSFKRCFNSAFRLITLSTRLPFLLC